MTTTMVLARNASLSYDVMAHDWNDFLGDCYTAQQVEVLVPVLIETQREEFNAFLPEDCFWSPWTSEIIGPVDADLLAALRAVAPGYVEDPLNDAMRLACEHVIERFEALEQQAQGQ